MKKVASIVLTVICLWTLAGCGAAEAQTQQPVPPQTGQEVPGETITLRIVDGAERGTLVLAGKGAGDVYTLNLSGLTISLDGKPAGSSSLQDGMMVEITYDGSIQESYPAGLGGVTAVAAWSFGTEPDPLGEGYDLCGLYLRILEDLWAVDSGLNDGTRYVSVDLSQAPGGLTEGEQSAIVWLFSGAHEAEGLNLTYEQLAEQGYLTATDIEGLYTWEDGLLFSIKGEADGSRKLRFDAQKWRTPLGAYFFIDCKASRTKTGAWSDYTVGSEAIS